MKILFGKYPSSCLDDNIFVSSFTSKNSIFRYTYILFLKEILFFVPTHLQTVLPGLFIMHTWRMEIKNLRRNYLNSILICAVCISSESKQIHLQFTDVFQDTHFSCSLLYIAWKSNSFSLTTNHRKGSTVTRFLLFLRFVWCQIGRATNGSQCVY